MRQISGRVRNSALDHEERRSARRPRLSACLLAGVLALASFAPLPLVLPVVSVILVLIGCLIGAYSWLTAENRDAGGFTRWDQAGLFMLTGFIAALMGDATETLHFIEAFAQQSAPGE